MDILTKNGKIDLSTNSLRLTEDRSQQVAQRLYIRLNTHKNTWFLDLDLGIDYLNEVFGLGRTKQTIDVLIQSQILADDYVSSIEYFKSSVNSGVYSCQFRARCTNGVVTETVRLLATTLGIVITTPDGDALSF